MPLVIHYVNGEFDQSSAHFESSSTPKNGNIEYKKIALELIKTQIYMIVL